MLEQQHDIAPSLNTENHVCLDDPKWLRIHWIEKPKNQDLHKQQV